MNANLYDELKTLVGKEGAPTIGPDPVCRQMIRHWCEAMEDANPLYTDESFATKSGFQNIVSPPAMTPTWSWGPVWPDGQETRYRLPEKLPRQDQVDPAGAAFDQLNEAGFVGTVDLESTMEFIRPLYPGDRVTARTKLANVTAEKKTRLGNGYFLTYSTTYTNQEGDPICYQTLAIFKFKPVM